MFAVLMNGKCSSLTTFECFASFLRYCSPLILTGYPSNKHCKAVQKRVAQLSVFKGELLAEGGKHGQYFNTVSYQALLCSHKSTKSCSSLRSFPGPYLQVSSFLYHSEEDCI